jgi:hypothetical protein
MDVLPFGSAFFIFIAIPPSYFEQALPEQRFMLHCRK